MVPKTCSIPECELGGRIVRGWCMNHYERWRRSGDPGSAFTAHVVVSCSVDGCDRDSCTRGWCDMHYRRWKNNGDPNESRRILGDDVARFWSKVDKTETCWNWTDAIASNDGYGQIYFGGQYQRSHRVSYQINVGRIPEGLDIDHMCHNRACVNPEHLRTATNKQNTENPAGLNRNNTSGARGVSWDKVNKAWRAAVVHNGKTHRLGRFSSLHEASVAAKDKRIELFTYNVLDRIPA